MEDRFTMYDLVIETTRRCNAYCPHCLRGEPMDMDLNLEYVRKLFSQVGYISSLTLSGGEPSLVVPILNGIRELAEEMDVGVGSFCVVTNGVLNDIQFVESMLRWWHYSDEKEYTSVLLSTDEYHPGVDPSELLLSGLSFFREKGDIPEDSVLSEGRGVDLCLSEKQYHNIVTEESFSVDVAYKTVDGVLYLNCLGNLIAGCDWSYESQEEHIICTVDDDVFSAVQKISRQG